MDSQEAGAFMSVVSTMPSYVCIIYVLSQPERSISHTPESKTCIFASHLPNLSTWAVSQDLRHI